MDDFDVEYLKSAMTWEEDGQIIFHRDAFNLGKSLQPLLKSDASSKSGHSVLLRILYTVAQ